MVKCMIVTGSVHLGMLCVQWYLGKGLLLSESTLVNVQAMELLNLIMHQKYITRSVHLGKIPL